MMLHLCLAYFISFYPMHDKISFIHSLSPGQKKKHFKLQTNTSWILFVHPPCCHLPSHRPRNLRQVFLTQTLPMVRLAYHSYTPHRKNSGNWSTCSEAGVESCRKPWCFSPHLSPREGFFYLIFVPFFIKRNSRPPGIQSNCLSSYYQDFVKFSLYL